LRSKRIKESILDDFKGLGKVRRVLLLDYFGSLEKLRNATPEEIQKIEGMGPKLAQNLYEFLRLGKK
jgi:excinuclease ABC subunit C